MGYLRGFSILLALVWGLSVPASTLAQASADSWSKVVELERAGQLDEAIRLLESEASPHGADSYNRGTLYAKKGQWAQAVAYLEKAKQEIPHDPDVSFNLSIARDELEKILGPGRLDPASHWLERLADQAPLTEIRGLLGLCGLIMIALWLRSYAKHRVLRRALLQPAGLWVLFSFLLTFGLYLAERITHPSPPGMILATEIVRSGPGKSYLDLGRVEAGMKIRVLGANPTPTEQSNTESELWRQVRFSGDQVGWIPEKCLLLL